MQPITWLVVVTCLSSICPVDMLGWYLSKLRYPTGASRYAKEICCGHNDLGGILSAPFDLGFWFGSVTNRRLRALDLFSNRDCTRRSLVFRLKGGNYGVLSTPRVFRAPDTICPTTPGSLTGVSVPCGAPRLPLTMG
jgi:hypothetical protein